MSETAAFRGRSRAGGLAGAWNAFRAYLPEGRALPAASWNARHRFILGFLVVHAVGLTIFGLAQGWGPAMSLGEGALIALVTGVAALPGLGRRFRSSAAAFAAVTTSAVFTQFWGGYIEGHFHYFVVVALIALYQDWAPFLVTVGFVAFDHGLIGTLAPEWVYNHPDAIAHPWKWAAIHAALVLGECAILVTLWKSNEDARARTDVVLNSAGEGILGLDSAGRVTFANPAAARLLGQPVEAIVSTPADAVFAASSTEPVAIDVARMHLGTDGGGRTGRGTAWLARAGQKVPLDWSVAPVVEHGEVVGSVLTMSDGTERLRAEEERAKGIEQRVELERLREMDHFKSLFINTAAHELHTPLTPLRLNVFALKEGHKGVLSPAQLSVVDVLDRNVERLSHLIEDVLNVARLQANRMILKRAPTDLSSLVHEAVDSFQESARAAGVTMETRIPPNVVAEADGQRLSQVLFNLLDNAMKFTPKGGRVTIEVEARYDAAVIRVSDDGVGLKTEDVRKLFQPFSQAHSHMERTNAGSGLGLFISKGIVDLHGGSIACLTDGPGKGATFEFRIPLAAQHVETATVA